MRVQAAVGSHFDWLIQRTNLVPTARFRAIEAVDSNGDIRGMIGFDCWTANSCEAHMAVDSPIVWRSLLYPAFQYPFEQMGRGVILAIIPANNKKSIRMATHLGFTETHRVRDGYDVGVDVILHEMRREECRWLYLRKAA